MTKKRMPELLAPAGSPDALRAAVANGADAVYLGGRHFGARAYAENFTREEMIEAFDYAHVRGVRIYVTVNTLVDNGEFGELADYLFFLYREGADAVLVQDLGVAGFIRSVLPELPLHGSTQMTVHNASGVQFLADLGFRRVVLARETTYADLQEIKRKTSLELEVFVHGALCFCYSGQCLFSSLVGGRSGNRGCCAQPCRLPYRLVDAYGKELDSACPGEHLLSPKDLMLIRELPALIDAGVTSLKIEGRMKRPEYVATVVRIYRAALDRAYGDPAGFEVTDEEIRDLAQIFNRGFTTGYFYGNPRRRLIGYTKPNNRGLPLGRVTRVTPERRVVFETRLPLRVGDGIEFWTGGGREGMTVHSLQVKGEQVSEVEPGTRVEITVPFPVREGDRIFKTHDERLIQAAQESLRSGGRRRVPLRVRAAGKIGEPFVLEAWDPDGLHVVSRGSFLGESAIKHPLTPEKVREQVDRLGNTPFALEEFNCELDRNVMFPLSEINAVRRDLTAALEVARVRRFKRSAPKNDGLFWKSVRSRAQSHKRHGMRPALAVAVGDFPALQAALEAGAEVLYFGGPSYRGRKPWSWKLVEQGIEMCREQKRKAFLILPRIWQERDRASVEEILVKARALHADGVLVGDLGGLYLALQTGQRVITDFSVPVFNDPAVMTMLDMGVRRVTISPELNREQLHNLAFRGTDFLELLVHGTLPLMISEHCITGAVATFDRPVDGDDACPHLCRKYSCFLKDRRGYLFPLVQDEKCRMTLYNARELCLIEFLDEILAAGYSNLRLELRYFEAEPVKRITAIYREACDLWAAGRWNKEAGKKAWKELSETSLQGLTRGHYLRGVLQEEESRVGDGYIG
ncbi:MAG TPA: U32 family peptidase [Syntrophomonadaceae bacterium]|nr:U32 family peptidase [Syntrophomonadaceae bacterium]